MLLQKRPRQILKWYGGLGERAAICGNQLRRRRGRGHEWSARLKSCSWPCSSKVGIGVLPWPFALAWGADCVNAERFHHYRTTPTRSSLTIHSNNAPQACRA